MEGPEGYLQTEIEYDIDTQNPREVRLIIKSPHRDMTGIDLYDALHCLVHDILEPELRGKGQPTAN